MARRTDLFTAYALGLAAWAFAFVLATKFGAVSDADFQTVLAVRYPRAILASAVGIGLSVAGAVLQALFANPLCEPYTLGISSGSALGAIIGSILGLHWMVAGLASTAFIGAMVFASVLYLISLRPGSGGMTLLLGGVMLGFLGSSLIALCMALTDTNGLQAVLVWLLGDMSKARMNGSLFTLVGILGLSLVVWTHRRELDAFLMGEEGAIVLGIDVGSSRRKLLVFSSLIVGLSVSAAGMIGFIGLIIPHFVRRMVGSLHLNLLPLCAIWGAAALTASDTLARVLVRPYELPVGVVTALVGAPAFLWILLARSRSESSG